MNQEIQSQINPEINPEAIINEEARVPLEEIITTPKLTIGELLKNRREEKGLNLKTISQQTKIHMGLLEYLENNQLDKLPSRTYVRGFVKSAAKILGINQDIALEALDNTYNKEAKIIKKEIPNLAMRSQTARNTLSTMSTTPMETVKSMTASSSTFLAKAAVVILLVGVVGFNIKNLADRSAEEHLKLPKVFTTIHQKIKTPPKSVVPKIERKLTEADLLKVDPIKVNLIEEKKVSNQKTEVTINEVSLKSISLGEKQFAEDHSISNEKLEEIFPLRYRVHVTKGIENLYINALDGDSWITYKVDDKEIKKYVLRQGRSVFIRGEKVRLFLGNTKSVKVFYNNKLISLNAKGNVKNLVFPDELKTKYMNPLFIFQKDGTAITSEEYLKNNQKLPESKKPGAAVLPTPVIKKL